MVICLHILEVFSFYGFEYSNTHDLKKSSDPLLIYVQNFFIEKKEYKLKPDDFSMASLWQCCHIVFVSFEI